MDGRNDGAVAVGTIDPKKADRALRKIFRRFFQRGLTIGWTWRGVQDGALPSVEFGNMFIEEW